MQLEMVKSTNGADMPRHQTNTTLTRHTLTVSGLNVVAYESGSGAPLLLLHGSPDSHAMWLPLMQRLSPHLRAIAPDLPGYGASALPAEFALTLDNMADFIRDLLAALHISAPVTLVMTDFGGHYGMAFAVKYPEQVRGLVISNTSFFRDYQWHSFARLYRVPLLGELLLHGTPKRQMLKALKNFAPALPDAYIKESYAAGFGSARVRRTILRMYRTRNPQDFTGWDDQLLALLKSKPALVLWGDQDPFISKDYAERYSGAQVQHFASYSHWLPLEVPDEYAAAVLAWLAQQRPAA